jgi:hypothetical protein
MAQLDCRLLHCMLVLLCNSNLCSRSIVSARSSALECLLAMGLAHLTNLRLACWVAATGDSDIIKTTEA